MSWPALARNRAILSDEVRVAVAPAETYRTLLGTTQRGALLRVAAHQALMLALVLSYVWWSAGGWFRLSGR